jgi:ribosomal protein S18 acetylase RimI-like enzyme
MRRVGTEIRTPEHCSDAEIAAFCCFVRQGGEVEEEGLEGRVRRAKALVFLYVGGTLVGVAALKQPSRRHRDGVFKKAAVSQCASSFALELGYVYVLPEYRGKHYSEVLSAAAKSQSDNAPIFATTRSDNERMQKTLERLEFKRIGDTYDSERSDSAGRTHKLLLYVKSAEKPIPESKGIAPIVGGLNI